MAQPELMRAAVIERFGGPEVIEIRRIPKPVPAPSELLVEVVAAGVNPVDAQNRTSGAWAGIEPPIVLGSDASGIVREVGDDVTGFAAGDEVFYFSDVLGTTAGSYAEYQAIDAGIVARRPMKITHGAAATLPIAAGTAHELVSRLAIGRGDRLLICGAGGGVGTYLVQLAKLAGATVIAVASANKHAFLRDLGAEEVIDYTTEDVGAAAGHVDAVADLVGSDTVQHSLTWIAERGRVASICALEGDFDLALDKNVTLHGILVRPDAPRLRELARLVERGGLRPVVTSEFALADVASAHRRIEEGHVRGKLVLRIRPEPANTAALDRHAADSAGR
jgi:NADPH:quinone reductase